MYNFGLNRNLQNHFGEIKLHILLPITNPKQHTIDHTQLTIKTIKRNPSSGLIYMQRFF